MEISEKKKAPNAFSHAEISEALSPKKKKTNKNKAKTENEPELKSSEEYKNTTEIENTENDEVTEEEDTLEVKELKECLNNLELLNSKIEAYKAYLESKPLEFNGYKNMENLHMSHELKKKIVTAVIEDNINEVEYLLDYPEADINMTWFSENLLMIAIRNGNEKMAEYLITKGINVAFEIEIREITEDIPFNYYKYSCRDMAFDKGLYDIICLIDIFNENTNEKIIRYLGKKYLTRNLRGCKDLESDASFKKKLNTEFTNIFPEEVLRDDLSDKIDSTNETTFLKELDEIKPSSAYGFKPTPRKSVCLTEDTKTVKFDLPDDDEFWDSKSSRTLSTASLFSNNAIIKEPVQNSIHKQDFHMRVRDQKELAQNILDRIKLKSRISVLSQISANTDSFVSVNNQANEIETQRSTNSQLKTTRSEETSRCKVSSIRTSIELSRSIEIENDKIYTKSTHDSKMLKQISKIKNHRYLACLSQRPVNRIIIEKSLKKYNEPLFPVMFSQQNTDGEEYKNSLKKKIKISIPSCPHLPELNK